MCLPGLSRTGEDFDILATALAGDAAAPRRVLALDYRGRGLSAWDPNPKNYTVATELDDVLAVLTALEAAPAIIIGTSRGGLIAMALAARQPGAIAGVVLNDIGPVIEAQGLLRIKGYVGKLPQPHNFAGRRRDFAPPVRGPVSKTHRGGLARRRQARLAGTGWPVGRDL